MKKLQFLFRMVAFASLLLSACGSSNSTPDTMMHESPATDAMLDKTPTAEQMMEAATPDAMMESPSWFSATLTDANSGNTFTINDFKGKVILVETMAVWCSTCKRQQDEIKALHEQLGMPKDLVSISLDIDANENLDTVKSYLGTTGFDWLYAVATADMAREIAALYGDQFLNPPSAPVLIIDRHGVAHPLPFGLKSSDDLFQEVNMYLKEGM